MNLLKDLTAFGSVGTALSAAFAVIKYRQEHKEKIRPILSYSEFSNDDSSISIKIINLSNHRVLMKYDGLKFSKRDRHYNAFNNDSTEYKPIESNSFEEFEFKLNDIKVLFRGEKKKKTFKKCYFYFSSGKGKKYIIDFNLKKEKKKIQK